MFYQDAHCRICGEMKIKTIREYTNPDNLLEYTEYPVGFYDWPLFDNQSEFLRIVDIFCPSCMIVYKVT